MPRIAIRERPPIRVHYLATAPNGRRYRWGHDEPRAADVPTDEKWSDTMPGGYEAFDAVLSRKPREDYSDLIRLSTIQVVGAGGEIDGEYRLEDAPSSSGDQMAMSPSAVGWQAHMDDNKLASMIPVDRDQGNWEGMSVERQAALVVGWAINDASSVGDQVTGIPAIQALFDGPWSPAATSEGWYDAGAGNEVGNVYADVTLVNLSTGDTHAFVYVQGADDDAGAGLTDQSGNLRPASPIAGYFDFDHPQRYAVLVAYDDFNGGGDDGISYGARFRGVAVYGNHGLRLYGDAPGGVIADEVIAYALGRWCPKFSFSTGPNGTIRPCSFVIPHLEFRAQGPVSDIVKGSDRFELRDWAVWHGEGASAGTVRPTFYYHERGARGKRWIGRVAENNLDATGPTVGRLWNGLGVEFQDTSGRTMVVGPPGTGSDVEYATLRDPDPENPANQLGIERFDKLVLNKVSTPAAAERCGVRYMQEARQLDHSGKATFTGHVMDDRGVWHPYHHMHAGDEACFVDSRDPSPRRIVKTEKDRPAAKCNVDLDAPPEGLAALLERIDAKLVPYGL